MLASANKDHSFAAAATKPAPTTLIGFADYGLDSLSGADRVNRLEWVSHQLGTKITRLSIRWAPGMTALDPGELQMVNQADQTMTDQTVLYTLSADQGIDFPNTSQKQAQFVQWLKSLASHSSANYIEAWNEPMEVTFNDGLDASGHHQTIQQRAIDYGKLQILSYNTIHSVRPGATVIAGSLVSDISTASNSNTFMKALINFMKGNKQKAADALSLHYPYSKQNYNHNINLEQKAYGKLPIWVTEDGSNLNSPQIQAADTQNKITLARAEGAVAWINLQAQNRPDLTYWHTGAFDKDWNILPAGTVIKQMSTTN